MSCATAKYREEGCRKAREKLVQQGGRQEVARTSGAGATRQILVQRQNGMDGATVTKYD